MISQLIDWIEISWDLFNQSSDRITWNLFLAFIPLTLSFYLFRLTATRNFVWWLVIIIFLAFLPNAPYILTDSIHILELSQQNYPWWAIILILIPQYILFITLGFEAYVISLSLLEKYLTNLIAKKYTISIQAIAHFLCVIGIYLGRFERFNSWDLVTKPGEVILKTGQDLLDIWTLSTIAIAFLLIWLLSSITMLINNKLEFFLISKK
ncbi:MAG: DUF1361 domain-containing protein [Waterburya sp.]